jgi:hypothetical protein
MSRTKEDLEKEYQTELQLEIVPRYEDEMKEIIKRERTKILPVLPLIEEVKEEKKIYH